MNWNLLQVELWVGFWIILMLVIDALAPTARRTWLWLAALLGILVAAFLNISLPAYPGQTFHGMYVLDEFARYFKSMFLFIAAVVVIITRVYQSRLPENIGAFYVLLMNALLGMLTLASVNDLLLLFLGLELLTFSLYIMVTYAKTDAHSIEAGMKYLIVGSVSSGLMVYGIALLYGAAGSTNLGVIRELLWHNQLPSTVSIGILLILAGLGFKLSAVPFQLWAPDVYQGAPIPVVALLSAGSKVAGTVAMLRVFTSGFIPVYGWWSSVLAILSALTLFYGNLVAIPQTNIKRLLAYSSIGHAGYLLMGLSNPSQMGTEAVAFYLLAYIVSNLAVFLVVAAVSQSGAGDRLEDYNGLSKRSPFLAAAMFIGLLSLAGVPPLSGFIGKLLVLLATVEGNRLWLVVIGAVNVAISLYYYLMVVKRMYLDAPRSAAPIAVSPLVSFTLLFLLLGIVGIGVLQDPFLDRIKVAVRF